MLFTEENIKHFLEKNSNISRETLLMFLNRVGKHEMFEINENKNVIFYEGYTMTDFEYALSLFQEEKNITIGYVYCPKIKDINEQHRCIYVGQLDNDELLYNFTTHSLDIFNYKDVEYLSETDQFLSLSESKTIYYLYTIMKDTDRNTPYMVNLFEALNKKLNRYSIKLYIGDLYDLTYFSDRKIKNNKGIYTHQDDTLVYFIFPDGENKPIVTIPIVNMINIHRISKNDLTHLEIKNLEKHMIRFPDFSEIILYYTTLKTDIDEYSNSEYAAYSKTTNED